MRNILFACFVILLAACASKANMHLQTNFTKDFMYQYSIIDALLAGAFDGNLTIGSLRQKGDFGIGTFNRIDGELVMSEGLVYRTKYNGETELVSNTDSTSAAFVKFFKADTVVVYSGDSLTYASVQQQLLQIMNKNSMYALRIKSEFATVTSRAEYPATKPYTTLSDHLKTKQTLFNLTKTQGAAIGFWLPAYMARTNVPGFHMHYLSDDKKLGGHIFNFTTNRVVVEIDEIKGFVVEKNDNPEFRNINLQADRAAELKKIE